MRLRSGLRPDPAEKIYNAPRPLAGFKGGDRNSKKGSRKGTGGRKGKEKRAINERKKRSGENIPKINLWLRLAAISRPLFYNIDLQSADTDRDKAGLVQPPLQW